ncbi:MAG: hypothetical protein B9J98_03390 [Candidatus Terraquivivens tikiterensis]|uniref:DOD-type homing endonuclease domain-containing protein n=1 Tax=Candidatus Terraquivivens tikiterensis TaxID=1980982 RepID=A0A2R7Y5X6_9ARCH|nr:MAG: hypothetical protein B9J98_03390 [Candidatus Terraquivivens tikiterensis]
MYIDPYIVGIFFGDGVTYKTKHGAYCVWIDQKDKNKGILESEVIPRLKKMGLKVYFYSYYAKADRTLKWRVLTYSKELYMAIRSISRRIAEYFSTLSDKDATQFIAGFFDAEGTKTDRIVIYNQNLELLKIVKQRLINLSIQNPHIYRFGSIYGLQIYCKRSVKKFLELIPSCRLKVRLSG